MARDDDSSREASGEVEFELDPESGDDLEGAMKAALDAVEQVESRSNSAEERPVAAAGSGADDAHREADGEKAARGADRVRQLEAELKELRDRSLRTLADFDNFRKRATRERDEAQRSARVDILREVLPIVDNLERAIDAGGSAEDLKTGVDLILKETQAFLQRHGVSKVESLGERFNPALHEAVSRHEDQAVAAPTVGEEFQAGYTIGERLLRPAIVKVMMPADGVASSTAAAETEGVDE